jgi:hypothetical protein
MAPPRPFADSTHYVLTFHDSTLEAVASGIDLVARCDGDDAALAAMAAAAR